LRIDMLLRCLMHSRCFHSGLFHLCRRPDAPEVAGAACDCFA
jgi:hypothetical protein